MKIKSEGELANVLGMAFAQYANQVAQGAVYNYVKLLTSSSVDVLFTVSDEGIITVKPFEPFVEPIVLKEEETPVVEAPVEEVPVVETPVKPKRSRRKPTA